MAVAMTEPQYIAEPAEVEVVSFDEATEAEIAKILAKYPTKMAGLLPVLWVCQYKWGWLSPGIMKAVADRLELSPAYVQGVTTFYTMYQTSPPGRYLLQVCTTLSCALCGTPQVVEALKSKLGIDFGETTADGKYTMIDVQCLGACGEAPVIQVNNDYYTEMSIDKLDQLLGELE